MRFETDPEESESKETVPIGLIRLHVAITPVSWYIYTRKVLLLSAPLRRGVTNDS